MKRKGLKDRRIEGQDINKAVKNTYRSNRETRKVMLSRVKDIVSCNHSYFITFTIEPKQYGYKIDTYIRKIKEALRQASIWVANVDYGKDNGRLHFHALAGFVFQLDYNIDLKNVYKFGNIHILKTYDANDDAMRNYILKYTLHAKKDTANTLYYSRKKRT